jgi:heterodisulfide reductase subunit A
MTSALSLAKQGYETHLVERNSRLGGQAQNLYKTWKGEDIQHNLSGMIDEVENETNIHIHLNAELIGVDGFVGNFKSALRTKRGEELAFEHGVAIIATGASEFKPVEYHYEEDSRIKTSLELDQMFINNDPSLKSLKTAIFIQCVGSREPKRPYCSRICCSHSIESALELKHRNPETNVFILYRDIRTYGERELLYKAARNAGVVFIRYTLDKKPEVTIKEGHLVVQQFDPILSRPVEIETDLITLATAIIPYGDNELAQFFKVPLNDDGFFVERHAKLGPSEFATDGVFLCGLAHYPKSIDESIVQGQAAASRAVTLLAKEKIQVSGNVAEVSPMFCTSCGVCIEICPYSAPSFVEGGPFAGRAEVNPVLCKGCGLCVASCRSGAINLKGFGTDQIMAMINEI